MDYITEKTKAQIVQSAQKVLATKSKLELESANVKFSADFALPCFKIAAELKKSPIQIAQQLATGLSDHIQINKAEAVNGYINIWLSDKLLGQAVEQALSMGEGFGKGDKLVGQEIVIEHTATNPFKEFHIGHAYTSVVGESLGRLLAATGAKVRHVSYHGDIGKHIAMSIWGVTKLLEAGESEWFGDSGNPGKTMDDVLAERRTDFLGAAYAMGASAFKEDEVIANQIKEINKHIYAHDDEGIDQIYETGKRWSFAYFDDVCQQLGVKFEKDYLESEVAVIGAEIVNQNIGTVFEKSDGAIIFKGEKTGLHTRVFINSQGLPTYEAKELGLTISKQNDFPQMTQSIVVTANEIDEYFKVLIAATRQIDPGLADKMRHISHGIVKLASGKMSSRTGSVVRAVDVLAQIKSVIEESYQSDAVDDVKLAALKYAFLKQRISGDILFDINESISLEGNSGPYLQYAYARAKSILAKLSSNKGTFKQPNQSERALTIKILAFPSVTGKATAELAPQVICTYLHELTQTFNRFYEQNRVIGDSRQDERAQLIRAYCLVLKNGLELLNIPTPERL